MTPDRPRSAPGDTLAAWRARRDVLEHDLDADPDGSLAWWWRIHLRICTYLLHRYQDDGPPVPPAPAPPPAPMPAPLAPRDVETPGDGTDTTTLPSDQLMFRERARRRIAPFLTAQHDVGQHVRVHANIAAERERQRQLRGHRRARRVERIAWGPAIVLIVVCASPFIFIVGLAAWSFIVSLWNDPWTGLSVLGVAAAIIGPGIAYLTLARKRGTESVEARRDRDGARPPNA